MILKFFFVLIEYVNRHTFKSHSPTDWRSKQKCTGSSFSTGDIKLEIYNIVDALLFMKFFIIKYNNNLFSVISPILHLV